MDELGLKSFPKTSGSTGLHVLAPIRPELTFPEVRRLAKALAQEVERRIGDQEVATTTWKVADRRGVFVDYGQNARDRTIASAYSIRPTPDARASAPLDWEEVRGVRPERFTLTTMRKRIDEVGDLTKGMWRYKRSLVPLFPKLGLEPADPNKLDRAATAGGLSVGKATRAGARTRAVRAAPRRLPPGLGEEGVSTVGSPRRRGGRTWRHVQSFGSLSGRKRMNRVPCRKRFFSSLS